MSVERTLTFDENTKLLNVVAITKDSYGTEQVKQINSDLTARLKQADDTIKKFDNLKFIVNKISKEPRTKELVEIVFALFPDAKMPDSESIEKTLKYWKDAKIQIEKDIEQISPFCQKSD